MSAMGKRIVAIVAAIGLLVGGYVGVSAWLSKPKVDKEQVEAREKTTGASSKADIADSARKSSDTEKDAKGTLTVEDLQNEPTMSAAVVAQYAADNLEEESWQSIKETLDKENQLKLVVVEDDNGVAYHYNEAEESPYYRLQGNENEKVTFYSAREKQVEQVPLKTLVADVNKKHTKKAIEKIKANTTIETGTEKSEPTPQKRITKDAVNNDSNGVFKKINHDYIFASGAGGWSSQMTISSDGTFTGQGGDSNYDGVSKWEFTGTFGNVNKVSDTEYTMDIVNFNHAPESKRKFVQDGQQRYEDYIKPWGIAAGEKVRVYLPGYSMQDLPEGARGWVTGSYGKGDMKKLDVPLVLVDNKGYRDFGGAPWIAKTNN